MEEPKKPEEALSPEDRVVFQKLEEARELYDAYLAIRDAADLETIQNLAKYQRESENPNVPFVPQPLMISFRSL